MYCFEFVRHSNFAQTQPQKSLDSLHARLQTARDEERSKILNALSSLLESAHPEEAAHRQHTKQLPSLKNTAISTTKQRHILVSVMRHAIWGEAPKRFRHRFWRLKIVLLPPTPENKPCKPSLFRKAAINYRASAQYDSMLFMLTVRFRLR